MKRSAPFACELLGSPVVLPFFRQLSETAADLGVNRLCGEEGNVELCRLHPQHRVRHLAEAIFTREKKAQAVKTDGVGKRRQGREGGESFGLLPGVVCQLPQLPSEMLV